MRLYDDYSVYQGRVQFSINSQFRNWLPFKDQSFYSVGSGITPNIPECVLNVPLLGNVAPVVWASGLKVTVPVMDSEFFEALKSVKKCLQNMYPNLRLEGEVVPLKLEYPRDKLSKQGRVALLFSGGLDSVFSLEQNIEASPDLVVVRGSDIKLGDDHGWNNVIRGVEDVAIARKVEVELIESNFYSFLDQDFLNSISPEYSTWWGGVQHGLGLSALLAPLAYSKGYSKVLISATHSEGYSAPWGSNPRLDNEIKFFGVKVEHYGYSHSRQAKLQKIINGKKKAKNVPLRVCYKNVGQAGENCCRCEKCLRTILGITVAGGDHSELGFHTSNSAALSGLRMMFANGAIKFDDNLEFQYKDIQSAIKQRKKTGPTRSDDRQEVDLAWIQGLDIDKIRSQQADNSLHTPCHPSNLLGWFRLLYKKSWKYRKFSLQR